MLGFLIFFSLTSNKGPTEITLTVTVQKYFNISYILLNKLTAHP